MPGNFKSSTEHCCVKCNVKAQEGLLYPLHKSLIFVTKPVVYIKIEDLSRVEFHRVIIIDISKE